LQGLLTEVAQLQLQNAGLLTQVSKLSEELAQSKIEVVNLRRELPPRPARTQDASMQHNSIDMDGPNLIEPSLELATLGNRVLQYYFCMFFAVIVVYNAEKGGSNTEYYTCVCHVS
jgi:hypothetical protein